MDRNEDFDRAKPSLTPDGEVPAIDAPASVDVEGRNETGEVPATEALASVDIEGRKEPSVPVEAIASMAQPAATSIESPAAGTTSTHDVAPPQDLLLMCQVALSAPNSGTERVQDVLRDNAIDLYRSLQSQDPVESILDRVLVGATNATMDCFERAARCNGSPPARDLNLSNGMKGARVIADMVKLRDMRRGQTRQTVTVGTVSVHAGGQAIVGNVDIGEPGEDSKGHIDDRRDD